MVQNDQIGPLSNIGLPLMKELSASCLLTEERHHTMRILLIDDHAILRDGLRMALTFMLPGTVVLEAESMEEALADTTKQPDVILLDISLPGINGIDGISLLNAKWPLIPILILSALDDEASLRQAYAHGATGFLSKAESADTIVNTIKRVLRTDNSAQTLSENNAEQLSQQQLTPRQKDVLQLLCQGQSNKLIARELTLSLNTIRRHVQDILQFFQVASRAEAVYIARNKGLIR